MRYLILGGAGFIGTNFCQHLLKGSQNNYVDIIDNLSTGQLRCGPEMLATYGERFRFARADISSINNIYQFFDYFDHHKHPHVIYNFACPASPIHYQRDPIQTILTTTQGVHNALRWTELFRARYFQASTSEIYGDPMVHPQPEEYHGNVNTWGPRACYDEGKRLAETLCYEYRNRVWLRVGRIFNTYGPCMAPDDGRVVSNFIVRALKNEPLTIYGDGSQTRSFQYINDLIAGINALMSAPKVDGPINLGTPFEFTVKELAEKVIRLTNSSSTIEYIDKPQDDPTQRKPDNTKLKNLDWTPIYSLDQGLVKTIEYFKNISQK